MQNTVDLTPTPRILHVLGDIPFSIWQCFAELMDNSFDAFAAAEHAGHPIACPKVSIAWSLPVVPVKQREICFRDNGPGMDLATLQKAAKAGYSSNDPIYNLGLFGMGFNIATARLGDETYFWSTRKGDSQWVGIKIDFDELVKNQTFAAPTVTRPKTDLNESGTEIVIRQLKGGIYSDLMKKKQTIREHLERIYTPILEDKENYEVSVQGTKLMPRPLCVWDKKRFVCWKGQQVHAVIDINEDLGESFFDEEHNRYLSFEEFESLDAEKQGKIKKRKQHLWGWLGVQRFGSTSEYGIDFIRNGRKILLADKRVFDYEEPEYGVKATEYPVDLGSTYGGRIVGELHVDYLIPTYQKNEFLPSGNAWKLTIDAIRGDGPLQKKHRVIVGYDGENMSPLGRLCSAYRRPQAGTENMCVNNSLAVQYAKEFFKRNPEYLTDEKWFQAAQEADSGSENVGNKVDTGSTPTTDPTDILDGVDAPPSDSGAGNVSQSGGTPVTGEGTGGIDPVDNGDAHPSQPSTGVLPEGGHATTPATSDKDELLTNSQKIETLSGSYTYSQTAGALKVSAYRLTKGEIRENGNKIPCMAFQSGIKVDFFFDPSHPTIANYPISSKQLLLVYLSQAFCARDAGVTPISAFLGLVENNLDDEKINQELLKGRANILLSGLTESLPSLLKDHMANVKKIIKEDSIEESVFLKGLIQDAPALFEDFQSDGPHAADALTFVSPMTIVHFVEAMPELFLDGKVFSQPYETISIPSDPALTGDLRRKSVEKVTIYLRDLASLMTGGQSLTKEELVRYSNSIDLLQRMYK